MLVHTINHLEWKFGPPLQVGARHWHMALNDIDTEDLGFVTLCFADDTTAQIGCCLFQRDTSSCLTFICDQGTMQMRLGLQHARTFRCPCRRLDEGHRHRPWP